jgi:WD40 repeat protein
MSVCRLEFTDAGRALQLVSCRDGLLQRRRPSSGEPLDAIATSLSKFQGDNDRLVGDVAAEGLLLATSDHTGTVQVRDAVDGRELWRIEHGSGSVQTVRLSSDGSTLAAVSRRGLLSVWKLASSVVTRVEPPRAAARGLGSEVALSRDGRYLVRTIGDAAEVVAVGSRQPGTLARTRTTAQLLAGDRDGTRIAISNGSTRTDVWDRATDTGIASLTTAPERFAGIISRIAMSGNGRRLALGGDFESVEVFDVVTGRTLFKPRDEKRRLSGSPLAFALDDAGQRLAAASEDVTLTIHDVDSRLPVVTRALPERVTLLTFSADDRLLATERADRVLQVWDSRTLAEMARVPHAFEVTALALSNERLRIVQRDGSVLDVMWDPGQLIRAACTTISRNLSLTEWTRYFPDEKHRKTCDQR